VYFRLLYEFLRFTSMKNQHKYIDIFGEVLSELWRQVLNFFNWRLVRGMGELQILTKISYLALVIVPVLVATWPALRVVINQHNKAVSEATEIMEVMLGDFDDQVDLMISNFSSYEKGLDEDSVFYSVEDALKVNFKYKADEFITIVNGFLNDFSDRALETPRFPWSLAVAFFSSLSVVLAHMLYQVFAPSSVKMMTWDEYVSFKKDEYAKLPTDEAIIKARELQNSKIGKRFMDSQRFEGEYQLFELHGMTREDRSSAIQSMPESRLVSLLLAIKSQKNLHEYSSDFNSQIKELLSKRLGIEKKDGLSERNPISDHMYEIDKGARIEYLLLASKKPIAIIAVSFFYFVGLLLIVSVIRYQTISIADAAQITSVMDLFFP